MRRGGLRAGECAEFTAQIAAIGKQPSVTSVLPLPVTPGRCPLAFPRLSGTESPTPTLASPNRNHESRKERGWLQLDTQQRDFLF